MFEMEKRERKIGGIPPTSDRQRVAANMAVSFPWEGC